MHTVNLRTLITWVQGGKLDGNTRTVIDIFVFGGLTNGMDSIAIILEIAFSIMFGQRGFTEHVIRITETFIF